MRFLSSLFVVIAVIILLSSFIKENSTPTMLVALFVLVMARMFQAEATHNKIEKITKQKD